jgi:phospholipase/carboxylesterase
MLEFLAQIAPKARDGAPVLVLLHGRGTDMRDLQGLARVAGPNGTVVTPQAPHPGGPWGYGPGWAWYRYLGEGRAHRDSLASSLEALETFMEAFPTHLGFRPGPLVLGGFSQGGTISMAYALTHPGALDGVVNLSGFLVDRETLDVGVEALGDTPLFWAHGTEDPAVPFFLAVEGRRRIREAGGDLEARDYRMGHHVSLEEMDHLEAWLGNRVPGWREAMETGPA